LLRVIIKETVVTGMEYLPIIIAVMLDLSIHVDNVHCIVEDSEQNFAEIIF
jgi:hypothetical protein